MNRSPTAVAGVAAAHHTSEAHTGVTALVFEAGARAAAWVPGSATGTRELGVLMPGHLAGSIHGICLSGGSAFGLAAADGVVAVLETRGIGFPIGGGRVPIVPAAILYDLHTATARPDAQMGAEAARAALDTPGVPLSEGRVGAGAGAMVGAASGAPAPGGLGCWSEGVGEHTIAATVAVNALGSVRDPDTGRWIAGGAPIAGIVGQWRGQTTLAAVVTDAPLDQAAALVVAKMASAGLARTLFPAFTPFDGDVVFVASTGAGAPVPPEVLLALGDAAARCAATAILRGVCSATPGEQPQAEQRQQQAERLPPGAEGDDGA